MRSKGKGGLRV